jgi:arylsulfatase
MKTRCLITASLLLAGIFLTAAERPNVILILADDMGYSDLGCYGGEINTPNLDSLAANGLRFTQFYNGARCCPTRASLLTGLYPHQAGVGRMITVGTPGPFLGHLNKKCVTIAEVLKEAGYATYCSGKWHVGENRPNWPKDRGFDRYYGLISGGMNYFNIEKGKSKGVTRHFADDNTPIRPGGDGFYLTDAISARAANFIRKHDATKPFFLYLPYTAPHWPLHADAKTIAKYRGKYLMGWEKLRHSRYARMKQLGLIDDRHKLSPSTAPKWDTLSESKKAEMDLKMAVYAAQVDDMDRGIGTVLQAVRDTGQYDNTIVMFLSDNGASSESGHYGKNFRPDLKGEIGTENSYHSYGQSWANASNTPFRKYKKFIQEGGIATPFIFHWPAVIKKARIVRSPAHVIDVLPTCADLAGTNYPETYKNHAITPTPGISLRTYLEDTEPKSRKLYWEHYGNAGARHGDWKLVRDKGKPWQLFDLSQDPTELNDLATAHPERAAELNKAYQSWARSVGLAE